MLAVGFSGVAAAATKAEHTRKGEHTHGVAWVTITHTAGQDHYIAGDFQDSKLGSGAIVYVSRVSATATPGTFHVNAIKITVYTARGSLQGTGSADEVITPSSATVTNGTFSLTTGTGAYKGHTFKGTFGGPEKQGGYTFTYKAVYG